MKLILQKKYALEQTDINCDIAAEKERHDGIINKIRDKEKILHNKKEQFQEITTNWQRVSNLTDAQTAIFARLNFSEYEIAEVLDFSEKRKSFPERTKGGASLKNDPAYAVIQDLKERLFLLEGRNKEVCGVKKETSSMFSYHIEFEDYRGNDVREIADYLHFGNTRPHSYQGSVIDKKLGPLEQKLLLRQVNESLYTQIVQKSHPDVKYIHDTLTSAEVILSTVAQEKEIAENKVSTAIKSAQQMHTVCKRNRSHLDIPINNSRVFKRLDDLLAEKNASYTELVSAIGYTVVSLSKWKNNKVDMAYGVLLKIAETLDVVPLQINENEAKIQIGFENGTYFLEEPKGLEKLWRTFEKSRIDFGTFTQMAKDGTGLTVKVLEHILEPIKQKTEYLAKK